MNSALFSDEEHAIVELGVGKNMVRAIRFWVQVSGMAELVEKGNFVVTDFGRAILGEDGFDRYLEDIRTLWLIHWQISTHAQEPLFAWDFLLNRWQHPEINRTDVVRSFRQEAERLDRTLSAVTLEQHFDVFLHTYTPTRSPKGDIREDNLDCPLVELSLIEKVGERKLDSNGKRESIYAFRRDEKPEITDELFTYCLLDFWKKRYPNEKSLMFRDISVAAGSPGQIFKLPESDIRERLERLNADTRGPLRYQESASLQQVTRRDIANRDFLAGIYQPEDVYA